jgi:hypothetical protein
MHDHRRAGRLGRLASLGLALFVAACTGTTAPPPDAGTPTPTRVPQTLDCETLHYPCSNADVDPAVRARSLELARTAAADISAGATTNHVIDVLRADHQIAEADADADAVRFRLNGGRPVWVMSRPDQAAAEAPVDAPWNRAVTPATHAVQRGDQRARVDLARVVGTDPNAKTAIVLAPYAFVPNGGASEQVAAILKKTRGYASGVTFLANETLDATNVSTNTYAHLGGHDVIFIDTPSGTICRQPAEGGEETCFAVLAAHELLGSEASRAAQLDGPGLEQIVWHQGGEAVGLSGDFFRTYYPHGIDDALIFLGGPDVDDARLIESIIGASSEIYWWDGERDSAAAAHAMTTYVARLAETGRSTSSVYTELKSQLQVGDARWVGAVPKGSDGQPDLVPFLVRVDGLAAGEEENTTINSTIGEVTDAFLPSEDAEKVAEATWQIGASFQQPDLHEGQTLTIDAVAQLAEGGLSRQTIAFRVTGGTPDAGGASSPVASPPDPAAVTIGRVYEGTTVSITELPYGSVAIERVTKVRLVRDPGDAPGDKHISFRIESGSMTWRIVGSSDECSFSAPTTTADIPTSEFDALTIHAPAAPGQPYTYDGLGEFEGGPSVDVRQVCDLTDVTYSEDVDGVWFRAPRDGGFEVLGDTIAGRHDKFEWSFVRVE